MREICSDNRDHFIARKCLRESAASRSSAGITIRRIGYIVAADVRFVFLDEI
jgi:hypothetical protein